MVLNSNFSVPVTSPVPLVSIIIPAYNQAHFLVQAIESVLAQTYKNYEIIVVNDGSTDNTAEVAQSFGNKIRYIYQENRGLAGARNTGISHAAGEYIALLDSDDVWLPDFLEKMIRQTRLFPASTVFFCAALCMDAEGNDLPQKIHVKTDSARPDFYETLVFANFIIPSTVVMKSLPVKKAGCFDESLRSCEDWDLWLTLLPEHQFTGLDDCLIRYRIHGSSLSTDPTGMHNAATAVVNKHFGPDDGQYAEWPEIKRKAYSGLYNYQAWTLVLRRNDWAAAATCLRLALSVDPGLASDLSVFYELLLGSQKPGYRGTSINLELQQNAQNLVSTLKTVFQPDNRSLPLIKPQVYHTAYKAMGLLAYNTGQWGLARSFLWRALTTLPKAKDFQYDIAVLYIKSVIKSVLAF